MSEKQNKVPTIVVVEPDDDVRPLLRNNLHRQGYRVIITLTEEDAIARARGDSDRPDLILINQYRLPLDKVIDIGRRIRQDAGLPSDTPIVIMAERYGEDMEGKDVKVGESDYVTYLEDGEQLMNLLQRLCSIQA
jgi:DNA-binding response OmpR family regulator